MFAYTIRAELNNDGTYRVELMDVDDERPIITTIERASILIAKTPDEYDKRSPLLTVEDELEVP